MSWAVFPPISELLQKANIFDLSIFPLPLQPKMQYQHPQHDDKPIDVPVKKKSNGQQENVYVRNQVKFSPEEDQKLTYAVLRFGMKNWKSIAEYMRTKNARQCQERWYNHLNPNIIKTPWTEEEDATLMRLYNSFGPKWMLIAKCMKNRSPDNVRNRWKLLSKRSKQ